MGLMAVGLAPMPSWADAGNPAFLAAARVDDDTYALVGLTDQGAEAFRLLLPGRGHAAAGHPIRPEAVAFARRPGNFAVVIDCASKKVLARLKTPEGAHFYGHGVFSADGQSLFTTENNFAEGRGEIGVWNAGAGYARVGSFPSGGIGPHELRLVPGTDRLVVANGGIDTHPETGRTKLNLPAMRPNLSYLTQDGHLHEVVEPPRQWYRLSIRHISVRPDGLVAAACQWQGDIAASPPLLATHRAGGRLTFHGGPDHIAHQMQGYSGSIAFSGDGARIAITGPKGGMAMVHSADGTYRRRIEAPDICGVAAARSGLLFTTGTGHILHDDRPANLFSGIQWDNHLVRL